MDETQIKELLQICHKEIKDLNLGIEIIKYKLQINEFDLNRSLDRINVLIKILQNLDNV